jgi:Flp pilus assembly protein TadG
MNYSALHRRSRRGGNLIEFAMILPVAVLLIFGIFENGWYVYQKWAVQSATSEGCRKGAFVHPKGAGFDSPTYVASWNMKDQMALAGLDCEKDKQLECQFTAELVGDTPLESLVCGSSIRYKQITGLIPGTPTHVETNTTALLEMQR